MDKKIPLRLDQQFCFPVYAASRLIIRAYQPLLAPLGISYPQYLVFLLLWEEDGRSMKDLRERLLLNSNTITPLMKRMEKEGWLQRQKDPQDERVWRIYLTDKGQALKEEGQKVPTQLIAGLEKSELQLEDLQELKKGLELLIEQLS